MRRVTLSGTELTTSALGYGCSGLMARTGRHDSLRLLEEAFEAGITHFDVARLYGYGEAEGALGAFLRGRRDQVTVTTKLGIDPPASSRRLGLVKAAARKAVVVAPALRRVARRQAGRMVEGGRFRVEDARRSLETSLRELGTDHVDLLLLHECTPADVTDELLAFLREARQAGSIRAFGTATQPEATGAILAQRPGAAQVVQVSNSVVERVVEAVPALRRRALATHSALGDSLVRLHRHLAESPGRARHWSDAVGVDCSNRETLGRLMLAWAVLDNPDGIVLFSSRDTARIRANSALADPGPHRIAAEALVQLVRAELA